MGDASDVLKLTRTLKVLDKQGLEWSSYSKEWFAPNVGAKIVALKALAADPESRAEIARLMAANKVDAKVYEAAQDPGRHPSDPWWDAARAVASEYQELKRLVV